MANPDLDKLEIDAIDEDLVLETDEGFSEAPGHLPRSRRVVARIQGKLETDQGAIDVETRNVSRTGALLATNGEEVSLGQSVQLVLENTLTGDVLDVAGQVVRLVSAQGTMVAIAVEFLDAEEKRVEIVRFFNDAYKEDAAWQKRAVRGPVEEFGIDGLIRMFSAFSSGGKLRLYQGPEEAVILLCSDAVHWVKLGRVVGEKALARVLMWDDATFEFESRMPEVKEASDPVDVEEMLAAAQAEVMNLSQLDLADLPMDTMIVVDQFEADVARRGFTAAEESVTVLAATKLTIRKILDIIPEPDSKIYPAILSLRHQNVLKKV